MALGGWLVATRQADIASNQAATAQATLSFAREESATNGAQTRRALAAFSRLAESAEKQSTLLDRSVQIALASSDASASAARSAAAQAAASRLVPFQNAVFQARLTAIGEYARASADLSTALHRAAIAVPEAAELPETLGRMTDAQLMDAASAARPTLDAWAQYIAISSAVAVPWDRETQRFIGRAEASGKAAYECFRWLGAYVSGEVIPEGWWNRVRREAAPHCDGFKHEVRERQFDRDAEIVLRVMTNKIREDDEQFVPGNPYDPFD